MVTSPIRLEKCKIWYRTTSARKGHAAIDHPFPNQSIQTKQVAHPISQTF